VPKFYFPSANANDEARSAVRAAIDRAFAGSTTLTVDKFTPVTREAFGLPRWLTTSLFRKLDAIESGSVNKETVLRFWETRSCGTPARAAFEVLRKDANQYIVYDDFKLVLQSLLDTHPGLEFLKDSPEFQDRYAETVIYRIFYSVNRSGSGRIKLQELKRSDLLDVLMQAEEEEDINKVLRYLSYEHFYVIYCKFWELDSDHDFLIDRDDLLRYGNHALTYRLVDRIFAGAPRAFKPLQTPGKMGYEDFCWFILSEEDKTNSTSLEYWFRCIDLDGDGQIKAAEMQFFYEEQLQRMECLSQEPVLFEDILCQMTDMIKPAAEGVFTLRDLRACKLSGNFFNVLFNLSKFLAFETRDPFQIRQEREEPHLTEFDRFARIEYMRLSLEEEDEENGDVWMADEAPF